MLMLSQRKSLNVILVQNYLENLELNLFIIIILYMSYSLFLMYLFYINFRWNNSLLFKYIFHQTFLKKLSKFIFMSPTRKIRLNLTFILQINKKINLKTLFMKFINKSKKNSKQIIKLFRIFLLLQKIV